MANGRCDACSRFVVARRSSPHSAQFQPWVPPACSPAKFGGEDEAAWRYAENPDAPPDAVGELAREAAFACCAARSRRSGCESAVSALPMCQSWEWHVISETMLLV